MYRCDKVSSQDQFLLPTMLDIFYTNAQKGKYLGISETLEEIDIRGRELFLKKGGKEFIFIPCLNNDINFIKLLEDLIINSSV